ncbi:MAG: tRNA-binding protein [Candidatus Bathyarchaeia archaeon]
MMYTISIDEFMKSEIRVVQVVKAEPIPGRSKILKLTVEVEAGRVMTMVVGGAQYYPPEHFVGRKFVALVNLASRRIAGVESQGMLLAAEVGDRPVWLIVEEDAPVGARVR